MAGLLRELVLSQQKTMFYTVTVSSVAPSVRDITRKIAPNLKVTSSSCCSCDWFNLLFVAASPNVLSFYCCCYTSSCVCCRFSYMYYSCSSSYSTRIVVSTVASDPLLYLLLLQLYLLLLQLYILLLQFYL